VRIVVHGSETVDGFVSASNETPGTVYDSAALKSSGKVDLEYVNGSAMLHTNFQQTALPDSVITTGVKVGDQDLSGNWRGCLQYAGAVTFKIKVKEQPKADFTMDKQVAEDADETETAEDEDEEAEKAEPEVKKAAMDAAIKQAENKAVQRVTQLFEARELVKPLVGVVAMDSAEAVLKHALKKSGIDSDGVDTVKGLKTLVGLAIKQKSQPQIKTAMDSASYEADPLTDRFK
jgi:hypothetical protein